MGAVAYGPVHDQVGVPVFDADGGRLLCWTALHYTLWCDGYRYEPSLVDGLPTQTGLPAALKTEPAYELFELYALLGCPLGFGQAAGAPLGYVLELLTDASFVLGFHAKSCSCLRSPLDIDRIFCHWVDGFAGRLLTVAIFCALMRSKPNVLLRISSSMRFKL